jgi:hypothetical protein
VKLTQILFSIGGWNYIVLGVLHLAYFGAITLSANRPAVVATMRATPTPLGMFGRQTDLLSLYNGFSFMMAVMLITAGGLSVLAQWIDSDFPSHSGAILGFNVVLSLVALILSVKFFFGAPVWLFLVSFVAYTATFVAWRTTAWP